MKEQFIEKKFNAEAMKEIAQLNAILAEYESEGFDLSLRQLYYQCVARGMRENTERSYKNLGNLVSDARMAGLMDWDMIRDRGRTVISNPHWNSPGDIVKACAQQFRYDRWENQPNYVEVFVEKQALEGVLVPVCQELDVSFTANKGYTSSSAAYEASKRYLRRYHKNKTLFALYLGDHDPSGIDMTRDVRDRLDQLIGISAQGGFQHSDNDLGYDPENIIVNRLALNMDQIKSLNPPENPTKLTDSRADGYIAKYGHSSWELDAIEPKALANLVRNAILNLLDVDLWEESGKRQQAARDKLLQAAILMDGE